MKFKIKMKAITSGGTSREPSTVFMGFYLQISCYWWDMMFVQFKHQMASSNQHSNLPWKKISCISCSLYVLVFCLVHIHMSAFIFW